MNILHIKKLHVLVRLILLSVLIFPSYLTHADDNVIAIDYIRGEGDVEGIKLAYQYHYDGIKTISPHLSMYFETSVNFWEYGAENKHDTNFVLAMSPVFRYQVGHVYSNPVYAELGIGISLLDNTQFAGKDVSTHYQFEDRLGVVYKFGKNQKYSVALRYLHYSNAGFKSPNPGLDFVSLSYSTKM